MKKIIVSGLCVVAAVSAPLAMADAVYTAWCGENTITVDKEAFEDEKDADEYFAEIDEYLCGPK